jgi:hypothetical protein
MIELLIAVTLVALLSVGLLFAMRIGLNAMDRANDRMMSNRRVTSVHRIVDSQISGIMPVTAFCAGANAPVRIMFFQGDAATMRLVSSYSMQDGWRGLPMMLEYQVIPGENGAGVRLIVNETPYSGPRAASLLCVGPPGPNGPQFAPVQAGPGSFVLADKLAFCRFSYRDQLDPPPAPPVWITHWIKPVLPKAIRVEMQSLTVDTSKLPLLTLTIPVRVNRLPMENYE